MRFYDDSSRGALDVWVAVLALGGLAVATALLGVFMENSRMISAVEVPSTISIQQGDNAIAGTLTTMDISPVLEAGTITVDGVVYEVTMNELLPESRGLAKTLGLTEFSQKN